MADFRRYQPRRSGAPSVPWGRWLIVVGVVVVLVIVGRVLFGGSSGTSTSGNENRGDELRLVTDNSNSTTTAANTNAALTNTASAAPDAGSWKSFSVKSCPTAISNFGTTKQVALTIGVSAANDRARQVLEVLASDSTAADFLVSGSFASKNQDFVRSIVQAGHAVYSQSYDSTNMATMTDTEALDAINRAEQAIVTATGTSPKPIFRPPAGNYTAQTVKLLNQRGYCALLWTVDAYDWQDGITAEQAQQRVLTALDKSTGGSIIALHAGYDVTPQLITDLTAALKARGERIVTLATLLTS